MENLSAQESRGYLSKEKLSRYKEKDREELEILLKSSIPLERTASINLLCETKKIQYLKEFSIMLQTEKKLYVKIALSDAIVNYGDEAVSFLVPLLGKIGNNHHRKISNPDLNEKSFPLPRDIAARILIRLGSSVLPSMIEIIKSGEKIQVLEALDVVGHVTWYSRDYSVEEILLNLYDVSSGDALMKWKIIRALQSFQSQRVIEFLENEQLNEKNDIIKKELIRSLNRVVKRKMIMRKELKY